MRDLINREYLPSALLIGVDYQLFWSLNPRKLEPFILAYEKKSKSRLEELNVAAWLNGVYFTQSIGATFGENGKYPEEPIRLFGDTSPKNEKEAVSEADIFSAYAMTFNKEFRKKNQK